MLKENRAKKTVGFLNFILLYSTALCIVMSVVYVLSPHNFDGSWWWVMLLLIPLMLAPLWLFTASVILTVRAVLLLKKRSLGLGITVISLYSVGVLSSGFLAALTVIRHVLQLLEKPYRDVAQLSSGLLPVLLIPVACLTAAYVIEFFDRKKNQELNIGFGGLLKKPITYIVCTAIFLSLLFVPYGREKFGIESNDNEIYCVYDAFICSYVEVRDSTTDERVDNVFLFFPKNYYKRTELFK